MRKPLFLIFLISLTLCAEMIDGVAILVKQEPITMSDIREAMKKEGKDLQATSDSLIREKLEKQEAKERKISVSGKEVYDEIESMAEQNGLSVQQLFDAMQSVRNLTASEFKAKIKKNLLNKKLYNAIAFSHMDQPTEDEEAEYYRIHIGDFTYPERFSLTAYSARDRQKLQEKINNPMFYSPEVSSEAMTLYYDKINPRLAKILNETPLNSFTPILPDTKGSLSFFVHEKSEPVTKPLGSVREQIANIMMGERRNQVLNDYFARLRLNADIKIVRLPQ
jgi:peptidyl-prolyl cis-trans isomerase SurA